MLNRCETVLGFVCKFSFLAPRTFVDKIETCASLPLEACPNEKTIVNKRSEIAQILAAFIK